MIQTDLYYTKPNLKIQMLLPSSENPACTKGKIILLAERIIKICAKKNEEKKDCFNREINADKGCSL